MKQTKEKKIKFNKRYIILTIIILVITPIIYSILRQAPQDINYMGNWYDVEALDIIFDLSYTNNGKRIHEQNILDEQIDMINKAQEYIILDIFLFNDDYNKNKYIYPKTSQKFADALIKKKQATPNIDIIFITDPINNFYGSYEQSCLKQIKDAQIEVIITDISTLKDPNYIYSGIWRAYIQWMGQGGLTWIPNLLDRTEHNVNLRSVLAGMNANGNHRKIIITDKEAMITSANPHDASTYHSNVAFRFKSESINELIASEQVVATLSKYSGNSLNKKYVLNLNKPISSKGKMRILTEKQIYYALKENIDKTIEGDSIYVCQFYLCDFDIIDSLLKASQRNVKIYMILDHNYDAMGVNLYGIPNVPAVTHLYNKSNGKINIKWYNINEVQYHTKMIYFKTKDYINIIGGSANFTRRNIKGYTLETDIELQYNINSNVALIMDSYFSKLWDNTNGNYTVDFNTYSNNNILKYWIYVLEESTGFGTF